MATPIQLHAFSIGEVSPALFGRQDLARLRVCAATMRNMYPAFQGGAFSRAGLEFVGFSKQTGRNFPPRLIPFQFSIKQGLALEFGNFYMRVISQGGFVTENPFQITGVTKANPAVVTYASLSTAVTATANNGSVTGSYVRGDTIVPAGGTFVTPATLRVLFTAIARLSINAAGSGYAVNDTITLLGGAAAQMAVITVTSVTSGAITGIAISNGGRFTTNSTTFTQYSTSGSGTGATFQSALFGPAELEIFAEGSYTALPSNPVNQASTSGAGLGATYTMTWATPSALVSGDWAFIDNVVGMVELNGRTFIINAVTATTFELQDVYNANINSTGYTTYTLGGTASRIYTLVTPYSEEDLDYLKYTQSADVMSLCCVNQVTGTEYAPQDLSRSADDSWAFSEVVTSPSVLPPASASASTSSAGAVTYQYQITAVADDGTESVASPTATVASAVNVSATAGAITVSWATVAGVGLYNVYKATPNFSASPPVGALFGFAQEARGNQLVDSNIVPDMVQTPPLRRNPFAKGQIIGATVTAAGSAYTTSTITVNSLTGSGAVLTGVLVGGALTSIIVDNPGQNYLPTDTITVGGAGGSGATATLTVGAEDGTYPGVVTYFQQRRAYGYTLNNPDTYEMSQPGAYTNFDRRIPPIDSDAITGTPWGLKVDGIQWMVPMPGGLVVLTGQSAWQLSGNGGSSFSPQALTPSSQTAQQQAYNGISPTVPPIQILDDIVYVQAHNSIYQNIAYSINSNIYTGGYLTLNSSHLFTGYTTVQHCWCEEPYKILWSIRNDGILRSFTYLKPEQVAGWARHDTNGEFVTLCSITEPPVDAPYFGVKRLIGANTAYTIERMNNRIWKSVEDVWAVDCGLSLTQPTPDANLTASSASGLGAVTGGTIVSGGTGYSAATTAAVVDDNGVGAGSGAVVALTIVAGIITAVTVSPQGTGYTYPKLVITDPTNAGSGAEVTLILNNTATFTADAAVFAVGNVGSVIRMGGGIATITAFTSSTVVTANITSPITQTQPNSGTPPTVKTQLSGTWTMTAPRTIITGLWDLIGATVTGLADGNPFDPQVVAANGTITLATAASQVTVGMSYQAQLQSIYLDGGEPTIQGQRKKIGDVVARVQNSRGLKMGSNQPDGSTLSPMQIAPTWSNMTDVPDVGPNFQKKPYNAAAIPLLTGDISVPVQSGFNMRGQVALQQDYPLPMEILSLVPSNWQGDTPNQKAADRNGQ